VCAAREKKSARDNFTPEGRKAKKLIETAADGIIKTERSGTLKGRGAIPETRYDWGLSNSNSRGKERNYIIPRKGTENGGDLKHRRVNPLTSQRGHTGVKERVTFHRERAVCLGGREKGFNMTCRDKEKRHDRPGPPHLHYFA